jgi:hypothetical protein
MSERTEIEYSLLVNADLAYGDIRKIEITAMRMLSMISRMSGGDPNLMNFIQVTQKAIMWMRHLQMLINAFEAANGPIGWVYAAVTGASFFMMTAQDVSDGVRATS